MGSPSITRVLLVAVCVLAMALLALPVASAWTEENEVNLSPGEFVEVRIDHNSSYVGLLVYWITVERGSAIDVWVVPEQGWEEFHDETSPDFTYYPDLSKEGTRSVIDFSADLMDPGVYYIIIENPAYNTEDSYVYYLVEYQVESSFTTDPIFYAVLCTVVIAVIFIVIFNIVVRRREARSSSDDTVDFMKQMQGDIERKGRTKPRPTPPPEPPATSPFTPVDAPPPAGPPPEPPTYSEEVVRRSMEELGHDDEETFEG